eukprot:g14113.t1
MDADDQQAPVTLELSDGRLERSRRVQAVPQAFETWRLDFYAGGHGAVHVSEFADCRVLGEAQDAYLRPANKRDLGHRCNYCKRPFSLLGLDLVAERRGVAGPTQRFHPECWDARVDQRRLLFRGRSRRNVDEPGDVVQGFW